ncbi:MAG: T9SS type A sorting domain-containing protein [Bacteroidales bacterium]|nr:T9SS type A sorting domain-containing protein [Bacteroidales bacterium]
MEQVARDHYQSQKFRQVLQLKNFTKSGVIYYSFSTENETEVTISDNAKANIFQLFSACSKRVAISENGEVSVIIPAGNYQIQWQNMTEEPINWNISFNNNPDTDKDGKPNTEDDDDDNDGVLDIDDAFPYDKYETADNDKDGIGDNADTDDDNDGTLDIYDSTPFGSVSVTEVGKQADFKVIPNPAHDKIQLTGLAVGSTVSLKIIDSKGAVVVSQESYLCGTDIDVRKLKKGRYYIVIQDKDLLVTSTFDKQ